MKMMIHSFENNLVVSLMTLHSVGFPWWFLLSPVVFLITGFLRLFSSLSQRAAAIHPLFKWNFSPTMNKFSRWLLIFGLKASKCLLTSPMLKPPFQRWRHLGLEPVRRCTPSWCPAFNVSPLAVESSDFHVNVSPCAVESSEYHAIS